MRLNATELRRWCPTKTVLATVVVEFGSQVLMEKYVAFKF